MKTKQFSLWEHSFCNFPSLVYSGIKQTVGLVLCLHYSSNSSWCIDLGTELLPEPLWIIPEPLWIKS